MNASNWKPFKPAPNHLAIAQGLDIIPEQVALTPLQGKRPYRMGWQHEPAVSRDEIHTAIVDGVEKTSKKGNRYRNHASGYGIRTGEVSGGILAIDVDGPSADHLLHIISAGDLPLTWEWCSGKPGRRQLAYQLPDGVRARLLNFTRKPLREWLDHKADEDLDFRYNESQSALPPSLHPDTGAYRWIHSPTNTPLAIAPKWLCDLMIWEADREAREKAQKEEEKQAREEKRQQRQRMRAANPSADFLSDTLPDAIDEAKRRLYWEQVYQFDIKSQGFGKTKGFCPVHGGASGTSFQVNENDGTWYCQGCKEGGHYIDYLSFVDGKGTGLKGKDLLPYALELLDLAGIRWEPKSADKFTPKERSDWKAEKFREQFSKYKRHYRYTPTHTQALEYFYIPTPDQNTLTAIRSGLGTGKTTWLASKFFRELKGEGILQFGDKNGLLLQTCGKTHAYHIWADDESREMMADPAGRFAACIHSIIKFEDDDLIGKNLVFDEASTLIKTLLFSSHLKKPIPGTNIPRQLECIRKLKLALGSARRIVLLDAYLSDFDVAFFSEFMPEGMTVNKILNRSPKTPRKYIIHQGSVDERGKLKTHEYSGLLASIQRAIGKDESIALASDSQHWLKTTTERLGGEEKCHRIDRETSGEDWAKEFLKSPDDYLISDPKPVLGFSPSMGEGVSVDSPFHRIFGHFTATIGTTAQSQMLGRIRNCPNDVEVFIVPRGFGIGSDAPIESHLVTTLWEECLSMESKTLGGSHFQDYIDRLNQHRFLVEQAGQLEAVRNFERLHPRECLKFILELNGGEVRETTPDRDKAEWDEQKEMSDTLKDAESVAITNSEAISDSEAKTLLGKGTGLKREQQLQLERYQITSQFPGLEESAIWGPDVVRLLKFDDKDIRSQVETWILYTDDSTDFSAMRRDDWTHQTLWMPRTRFLAVETLKKLALKPILEASQFCSDSDIITDWVRSVTQMTPKECKARLGWKPRKDIQARPIQSLNELLAKIGLKAKRIKGDGKTRFYAIDYSKHQTKIWPILEAGRRQRMLEKLAKIQELNLAENNGCNPEGEGNPATDITPLNIYINKEVMSVDYSPNYRNDLATPSNPAIALDSAPLVEPTGSQWTVPQNKTTVQGWAALFQEVAEFPEADAETLKDMAIGCPPELKPAIWQLLDSEIQNRLRQISKTYQTEGKYGAS